MLFWLQSATKADYESTKHSIRDKANEDRWDLFEWKMSVQFQSMSFIEFVC